MKVSLSRAAKETNVSLPTLSRWRKKGLISADKNHNGGYLLDTSEYDRINELKKQSPNMKDNKNDNMLDITTTTGTTESEIERQVLKVEIAMLKERLAEKDGIIQDLKTEKDDWKKQAQTLSITDNRSEAHRSPSGHGKTFLARLLHKND